MAKTHSRPNRKNTGGKYVNNRKKKLYDLVSEPTLTGLAETTKQFVRTTSGKIKIRVLKSDKINVYDKKSKKYKVVKIKTIVENPANRHFVRRNIMTKGTIVETDIGKAKITSRPSQDGLINGILI